MIEKVVPAGCQVFIHTAYKTFIYYFVLEESPPSLEFSMPCSALI